MSTTNTIRIEAENYKSGQDGITYFDKSPGNDGGKYRSDDVDIYASTNASNGYLVGYTEAGEWLTYDVNITQPGTYKLFAHVASTQTYTMGLSASVGGQQQQNQFTGTGGWTNWTDVSIGNLNLSSGQQTLRVDELTGGFNIDYFELVPVPYTFGNIVNSRLDTSKYTGGNGTDTISYANSPSAIVANLATGVVTHHLPNSAQNPLKIMPVGDSITYGLDKTGDPGGYRPKLWNLLVGNGYNVDFVGPQSSGPDGTDKDHAGFPGWTITDIAGSINGWLKTYQPDKVLLIAGTNDILKIDNPTQTPNKLTSLIDQITSSAPYLQVLVASVPPVLPGYPVADSTFWKQIQDYNAQIPGVVKAERDQGKNVTFVDINSVLQYSDITDGVHPGFAGNTKIAKAWDDALLQSNSGTDNISNFNNIIGSKYDDVLIGDGANNILDGGGGNDTLTGGGGNNVFVLRPSDSKETITDFTIGKDVLGLSNSLRFEQLTLVQGTGSDLNNSLIEYNGHTIGVLQGVRASTLNSSSFVAI